MIIMWHADAAVVILLIISTANTATAAVDVDDGTTCAT